MQKAARKIFDEWEHRAMNNRQEQHHQCFTLAKPRLQAKRSWQLSVSQLSSLCWLTHFPANRSVHSVKLLCRCCLSPRPFWWKMKALSCSRWKFFPQLVTDRNVYSGSHLILPSGRREILVKKTKGLNCSQFITFTAGTISSPKYKAPLGWRVISLRKLHSHSGFFCMPLPLCLPHLLPIWVFDQHCFSSTCTDWDTVWRSIQSTILSWAHTLRRQQAPPGPYNGSEMPCPDLKVLFSTAPTPCLL